MAQATAEQIQQLETSHKRLMIALIQSARLLFGFIKKYGLNSEIAQQYKKIYVPLATNWYQRQAELEKSGGVQKIPYKMPPGWKDKQGNAHLFPGDFFTVEGVKNLEDYAMSIDKEGKGIGFIPLLIWAVILITGFFSAGYITDKLTATTRDQAALVKQTDEFCTAHGLSTEECKQVMAEQTEAGKNGEAGSYILPALLFAGAAYLGYELLIKKQSHKKQAA